MKADNLGKTIAGVLVAVGLWRLGTGYSEYASGDETLFGWLFLPLGAFAIAFLFGSGAMNKNKASGDDDA